MRQQECFSLASSVPRILIFGGDPQQAQQVTAGLQGRGEAVYAEGLEPALQLLREQCFSGVCVLDGERSRVADGGLLLQAEGLLSQIPDGLALLNVQSQILWSSARFQELTGRPFTPEQSFYDAFGSPEILGPDLSPFLTALGTGQPASSTLRIGEKLYYQVQANPISAAADGVPKYLIVAVRDTSSEILQQQKLNAIYQAGLELGDLAPGDLFEMSVQDRVELLKSRILHYTQALLEFETVEIRLMDRETKRLSPLLAVGMQPEAADRELYALPSDNGVTGFVAATGKSYLCEDTASDPLYLPGAAGARSSLTVPLVLHDEILGTFNVESPNPGAFSENDLQFLELFSREVAVALNTLELLVAEKATTATQSMELVLREVAAPVDEVLNDAAWIIERYIGHDPNVTHRLQNILKHTRQVKALVQQVGETLTPKMHNSPLPQRPPRPKMRSKRVLVADNDEQVRRAAHELLGKQGCEVETAHNGEETLLMVRSFAYDAVIIDIRLPDMNGYDCFCQIREIRPELPVILMAGYGYDAGHSIVKCRQKGVKSALFKPFRVDQLYDAVELAVSEQGARVENSGDQAGSTAKPPVAPGSNGNPGSSSAPGESPSRG